MEQVTLVTGAGRRIGAAIAEELAAQGHSLILHAHRSSDAARRLGRRLEREGGRIVAVVEADLTRAEGMEALLGGLEGCPAVTGLVNNAAIFPKASIDGSTPTLLQETFALNLVAPLQLMRTLHLRGGLRAVVNLLDARADRAWPDRGLYLASKAALESITRTAAREWAPATRVNGVALGPVEPEGSLEDWGAAHTEAVLAMLPLGRPVRPAEVAKVTALLLSEQSAGVTGAVWRLDAGRGLW